MPKFRAHFAFSSLLPTSGALPLFLSPSSALSGFTGRNLLFTRTLSPFHRRFVLLSRIDLFHFPRFRVFLRLEIRASLSFVLRLQPHSRWTSRRTSKLSSYPFWSARELCHCRASRIFSGCTPELLFSTHWSPNWSLLPRASRLFSQPVLFFDPRAAASLNAEKSFGRRFLTSPSHKNPPRPNTMLPPSVVDLSSMGAHSSRPLPSHQPRPSPNADLPSYPRASGRIFPNVACSFYGHPLPSA